MNDVIAIIEVIYQPALGGYVARIIDPEDKQIAAIGGWAPTPIAAVNAVVAKGVLE